MCVVFQTSVSYRVEGLQGFERSLAAAAAPERRRAVIGEV